MEALRLSILGFWFFSQFFFRRHITTDIFNLAMKDRAEKINGIHRDIQILSHPIQQSVADLILFQQPVLSYALFFNVSKKRS